MAGFASLNANASVLIDERATLIDVAFETGFFIALVLLHHAGPRGHFPGGIESSVRIVAIRALDGSLVHAMLEGHGELGAHRGMAAIAQVGLSLGQKEFRRGRLVNRMAIGAD